MSVESRADGRLVRGDQTRQAVLRQAMAIASLDGLEGLSIGRLAKELGVSKSGVFAHFGSKEELQLATVRAAWQIYRDVIFVPTLEAPAGLARIWALTENWIAYSENRVFPGGCFFAKATHEYASRPGAVRDLLIELGGEWGGFVVRVIEEARGRAELEADPMQLAFELVAVLDTANLGSLMGNSGAYDLARTAIRTRLTTTALPGVTLPFD